MYDTKGDLEVLELAMAAYRAALEEFTARIYRSNGLPCRAISATGFKRYSERKGDLKVLNRLWQRSVQLWRTGPGATAVGLGRGRRAIWARLSRYGPADRRFELLEKAVAAHRAALEELARERVPLDWGRRRTIWAAPCTPWAREMRFEPSGSRPWWRIARC